MANHKSALKRIRQTKTRNIRNHYYGKTMRNAVRKLRSTTEKTEAEALLGKVLQIIDKNAKRGIIHKNKASNLKSKLMKNVNALA